MNWLKSIILTAVGVVLLWLALRNLPLHELRNQLQHANYWLIVPVFIVTLFGYYVRIKRWQLLYTNLQYTVSFRAAWIALSAGYLVSYVVPRGGEVTRCLLVKRYQDVPFHQSLASVVIERITDTLCLMLFVTGIFIFNLNQTSSFFQTNVITPIIGLFNLKLLLGMGLAGIVVLMLLYRYLNHKSGSASDDWATTFVNALKQLILLQHKGAYLMYTLLIWVGYFFMTYLWVFAFEESIRLSVSQVFVVMIIGTIGKSVPIQGGGMGAYHYLVAQAFLLFGVGLITGNALAIIIHGAQSIYTLLTGTLAYGMLVYDNKTRNL